MSSFPQRTSFGERSPAPGATELRGEPQHDDATTGTVLFARGPFQWTLEGLRGVLDNLPAAAYTTDASGLITYFNRHAEMLWGRAPRLNDPIDRFCGSFKLFTVGGAPIHHDQCWMALALRDNREYNGHEILIERPDGGRLTVLAHANPLHDARGVLFGAVNILVDITERKEAEDALRDAARSKDEFLAMLAHELRNPLAPVRNAVEILFRQGPADSESRWALEVIDRQMRHMTRLIEDLMDISRITRNRLELRKERVELAEIVRTAVETSRPLLDADERSFTVDLPHDPIMLEADATRLAQALSNLLNNAAKYTADGGRIWLSAESVDGHAVVRVRDTGIGIPQDLLPRVFELFAQGQRAGKAPDTGLGIGLTLVRRLIELHGGSVEAASEGPGRGSEFVVRLPLAATAAPQEDPRAREQRLASEAVAPLRILVVDDNRDTAESLATLLGLHGHDVRTAHDGEAALEVAGAYHPDAIVLDIGLPGISGHEAARRIRAQAWAAGTFLVAVTGWGQDDDRQRSRDAGFDHHLVKPVDPAALIELLETRLETPPPAASGDSHQARFGAS